MLFSMKVKVILPTVTHSRIPVPAIGLGTLMSTLEATDELTVTAEQAQQPTMWEDADVVVITVATAPESALNLAELYQMASTHVVLIGPGLEILADSSRARQTVFVGRPDELWPAFLRDFKSGEPGHCYRSNFTLCDLAGGLHDPLHAA
jgi:hypothetical protein